jgi:hypothetical protein
MFKTIIPQNTGDFSETGKVVLYKFNFNATYIIRLTVIILLHTVPFALLKISKCSEGLDRKDETAIK